MRRVDSFEKTLMLGKIDGRRRRPKTLFVVANDVAKQWKAKIIIRVASTKKIGENLNPADNLIQAAASGKHSANV